MAIYNGQNGVGLRHIKHCVEEQGPAQIRNDSRNYDNLFVKVGV